VVLNASQPNAMSWIDKVKAVRRCGGQAMKADEPRPMFCSAKQSHPGRLPFTWAKRLDDYPATDPVHPERSAKGGDRKTTFSEGIDIRYRWLDKQNIDPLFPFGDGLSYTAFHHSDLDVVQAADNGLNVPHPEYGRPERR
jgi:beta-glucosidase